MKKIFLILLIFTINGCKIIDNITLSNSSDNNWQGENFYGFAKYQTVVAQKYMVATSEKIASTVGAEILKKGGSAVDAAIAVQMVLNVVEPHSSGIGGGLFLLYHDKKTKKNIYFNGRETAPLNSYSEMFLDADGNPKKFDDVVKTGNAVGVPGALHALKKAHNKYGKLKWQELFLPAIKIAQDGYPISQKMYSNLQTIKHLSKSNSLKIYFDHNGKAKKVGTIIHNYQLAKTLENISKNGIAPFYEGQIAKDIERVVLENIQNGGYLTYNDLKNYRSTSGDLICAPYRKKYKICSMPLPSSGGIAILQTLGIMENFDLSSLKPNSSAAIHLIAESLKLAYADRNQHLGDSKNAPIKQMLDKKYLSERAKTINLHRANDNVRPGDFETSKKVIYPSTIEKPSTTHVSIVDSYGNAVAMTSSIEFPFGSAIAVDGFILNNQMTDFSFVPKINNQDVINRIEPLKYPRSSMSPTFVFDNHNNLILVIGSPNGPRIIQHVLKTIIAVLDWNMDIQEAVSLPNFIALNGYIELEKNTTITAQKKPLQKFGHKVKIVPITSAIQAIKIDNRLLFGAADPRRQGAAIGN